MPRRHAREDPLPEVQQIRRDTLASRLRQRRAELGWSQQEVARRAGRDRGFYSELERARRTVSVDHLWDIAAALQIDPADLLRDPQGTGHGGGPVGG